jgi:hypothetical protein
MRNISAWFVAVIAVAALGVAAMPSPPFTAHARQVGRREAGSASPQAQYTLALQHLGSVGQFHFVDMVEVMQPSLYTVRDAFRYAAPNRLAMTLVMTPLQGQPTVLESIQVGTMKCQRSPSWVCFRSQRVDVVTLVRALVTPQLLGLRFSSGTTSLARQGRRYRAVQIFMSGQKQDSSYRATLTIDAATQLPLTLTGVVSRAGQVQVRQDVTFVYGGHISIQLPHGKGVYYPR